MGSLELYRTKESLQDRQRGRWEYQMACCIFSKAFKQQHAYFHILFLEIVIRDRVFCLPLDGTIVVWTGHGSILHRAERAPAARLWGLNTTSTLPQRDRRDHKALYKKKKKKSDPYNPYTRDGVMDARGDLPKLTHSPAPVVVPEPGTTTS